MTDGNGRARPGMPICPRVHWANVEVVEGQAATAPRSGRPPKTTPHGQNDTPGATKSVGGGAAASAGGPGAAGQWAPASWSPAPKARADGVASEAEDSQPDEHPGPGRGDHRSVVDASRGGAV